MILVVDDSDTVRECICLVLAQAGFQTMTASSGAEALEMLRGGIMPNVIVLDLMMPVMDGNDVLEELIKMEGYPPVIILSAYIHALKGGLTEHVKAVLEKPGDMKILIAEVSKYDKPMLDEKGGAT